ncbi:putative phosphodiesterase I [Helianthus anomalus]
MIDKSQPFIIHWVYFTNFTLTFAHLCSVFSFMRYSLLVVLWSLISLQSVVSHPFARIAIDKTVLAVSDAAAIVEVSPSVLGSRPKLITVSNTIAFANPKSPNYPRLAQGKLWNVTTVTWTSGYSIRESEPFVEWGKQGEKQRRSTATTLTFNRNSMCGMLYVSSYLWNMKDEADGSNEYNQFQRGSLNTTRQLIEDLKNIELVFHIGDLSYANGYLSQWDQFTSQIEPVASYAPYMIARYVVNL